MTDTELEKIIADLVKRKDGASEAERAMLNRILNGLRYKYDEAGPIWESIDILRLGRYSSLIPSWDSRCAVCGERHGVTYGFRSTLARNGIKGRYATME